MQKQIVVGKITGAFGIKGWVKIHSHTDPGEALFSYPTLKLMLNGHKMPITVVKFQAHGKGFIAKFAEIEDRNQAEAMKGGLFEVEREEAEVLEDGEFYWDDLIGLTVINQHGVTLGKVEYLFNAGASDVMVVKGDQLGEDSIGDSGIGAGRIGESADGQSNKDHLIPFIHDDFVIEVDMANKKIIVDWDEDF